MSSNKLFYTYTGKTDDNSAVNGRKPSTETLTTYSNSLIFDKGRHSIWTKGEEFGYVSHTVNKGYKYPSDSDTVLKNIGLSVEGEVAYTITYMGLTYYINGDTKTLSPFTPDATAGSNADHYNFVTGVSYTGTQLNMTYGFFTNTHTTDNDRKQILTYAWIDKTGTFTYEYTTVEDISGSVAVYDTTNSPDSRINVTTATRVLTSIDADEYGNITYTYGDIGTTFEGVVVDTNTAATNYYVNDSTIEVNNGTYTLKNSYHVFANTPGDGISSRESSTDIWNGAVVADYKTKTAVITNVNIYDGTLSYTFSYLPNLSGDQDGTSTTSHPTYITGVKQDINGKISYTYTEVNHTTTYTDDGDKTITSTSTLDVVTGVNINKRGDFSYTYNTINTTFTDLENETTVRTDYQYVTNNYVVADGNGSYTIHNSYATIAGSTSTGSIDVNSVNVFSTNLTYDAAGNITYAITTYELATKKYIDASIQANDAFRNCGIVKITGTDTIELTHNANPGPSHGTTPDTSNGAVYKVSENTGKYKVNGNIPTAGDMFISYIDDASATNGTGWNIISENLYLETVTEAPTTDTIGGTTNTTTVISEVSLDAAGTLTKKYTTISHNAVGTKTDANSKSISPSDIVVPANGTDTDALTYIKTVEADQYGHLTSLVTDTLTLKHGTLAETTPTATTEAPNDGTPVVSVIDTTNGHITGVAKTTIYDKRVTPVSQTAAENHPILTTPGTTATDNGQPKYNTTYITSGGAETIFGTTDKETLYTPNLQTQTINKKGVVNIDNTITYTMVTIDDAILTENPDYFATVPDNQITFILA